MEKRIKIMHIAQAYPGGVPMYIETLVKHLDKSRYENILVCSHAYEEERFSPFFDVIEKIGMERSISLSKILKPAMAARKLIKKYKPDVIYCHSSIAGAVGRVASIGCRAKVVYNAHSWAFNMRISKKKKIFYRWIEKILALFTDKILCVSNFEKRSALQNKICSAKKLEVILNGVDIPHLDNAIANSVVTKASLNIPENAYVIGMVGRISEQKAPDVFVSAARMIKASIPEAYFIIVGNGPDQKKIERMIKSFNLEKSFLITGWVNNPLDYLSLFDQALLLSRWEGLPLVVPEYFAAGKATICTKIDAIDDMIDDNYNGIIVDIDDYVAVSEAAIGLFQNQNKSRDMGRNAVTVAKNKFDIRLSVGKFDDLIAKLCS